MKEELERHKEAQHKVHPLVVLLVMLVELTACSETSTSNTANPDTADINLVTYTNELLGISGLAPEGWLEVKPGQFQPMPVRDPTLLGQVAFHGATMDQITADMRLPESVGSIETSNLTWDLYGAELEWPDAATLTFDCAVAESKSGVYLVALVSLAEEHEALYEAVMVPAIQAMAPTTVRKDQASTTPETIPIQRSKPIDTKIRPADGMVMVYVPAGEFEMGNDGTQWVWSGSLVWDDLDLQVFTDEEPQHTVYLDAYWIDQTEVTVGMFRKFVEDTGYETTAERDGWGAPWTDGPMEKEWPHVPGTDWQHPHGPESSAVDDHPVVQVSWDDAAVYCKWAGGHLPSEAQWEKAARGRDGRLFPWGNTYEGTWGSFCDASCPVKRWNHNSYDDSHPLTSPVGIFPSGASPYGALDMAGNVWEWVDDWYDEDYYNASPYENPTGPSIGTERTQRGGAWIDTESWVRTTVRHATPPWNRADDLGFRCALPGD
ncbi:MAG: SUMF1/EgtB/PvdO family nonheme iron enzyme [Anaerolineales bacterium]|nr:SUMF1/EgtB/PvdO family nonheme iron enzyme [Anaerolineales bacterium]